MEIKKYRPRRQDSSLGIDGFLQDRILHGEEVRTGRLFARVLGPIFGSEIQSRFVNFYGYIRGIEDLVDSGKTPRHAQQVVRGELTTVNNLLDGQVFPPAEGFERRNYLAEGIRGMNLTDAKTRSLLLSTREMLTGIAIDSDAILTAVENLFVTWIKYDALRDLDEDLAAGLILLPQSLLDQYGISFQYDEPIPSQMSELFEDQKQQINAELGQQARYIYQTSIPEPFITSLYLYFRSRRRKLRKTEYPVSPTTRFGQNLQET